MDNRIFAIKVVHSHFLDDEDLVQMFQDEASLSLRISHPNVVHVEEVGEDGGMHYLAMEYVHGCSVAQLLQALIRRRRRMSPELAVYIAMQVAEALDAAHELHGDHGEPLNVVHRDVSPQNILLSHTGELRLIDFGIAKSRARMHHSATGSSIRGKLRYMSPEHAKGRSVDRRTDVYALGVVLWEMLTMRPLFWGETDFDVLTKVQDPVVEPPSAYAPNISPALDDAVLSALSPDREGRPQTALAFHRMLSAAVPIAEALDEEQIAELLHAVLGEEMGRVAERMPALFWSEMRLDSSGSTTLPGKKKLLTENALETLTDPAGIDPSIAESSFAGPEPTPSGIHELLSAPSIELIEEETSVSFRAAEIASKIAAVKGLARPPDGSGGGSDHEEPTEQLSKTALAQIHEILEGVARKRASPIAPPGDTDTSTLDERVQLPLDERVRLPLDEHDPIDEEPSTLDEKLSSRYDTQHDPPPIEADVDDTTTTTMPSTPPPPPPPVTPFARAAKTKLGVPPPPMSFGTDPFAPVPSPHPSEPPTENDLILPASSEASAGVDPWGVPDTAVEPLAATQGVAPTSHDSEPPTTVWGGVSDEEEVSGFRSADTIALVAGIAVAVAFLAGIATYFLF